MIETIYSNPDFLEHHGMKGMHWGIRKDERSGSNSASVIGALHRSKNSNSNSKVTLEALKTKSNKEDKAKTLSDAELDREIARMLKEKQYRDLASKDTEHGKSFADKKLEKYGEQFVDTLVKEATKEVSKWLIKKAVKAVLPGD